MRVFTKRNAVIGWLVTRVARRRLERRLNVLAGNQRGRLWPKVVTTLATGAAVTAGALVARRVARTA